MQCEIGDWENQEHLSVSGNTKKLSLTRIELYLYQNCLIYIQVFCKTAFLFFLYLFTFDICYIFIFHSFCSFSNIENTFVRFEYLSYSKCHKLCAKLPPTCCLHFAQHTTFEHSLLLLYRWHVPENNSSCFSKYVEQKLSTDITFTTLIWVIRMYFEMSWFMRQSIHCAPISHTSFEVWAVRPPTDLDAYCTHLLVGCTNFNRHIQYFKWFVHFARLKNVRKTQKTTRAIIDWGRCGKNQHFWGWEQNLWTKSWNQSFDTNQRISKFEFFQHKIIDTCKIKAN